MANQASDRAVKVPVWIALVLLAVCIVVGAAFIWRSIEVSGPERQTVPIASASPTIKPTPALVPASRPVTPFDAEEFSPTRISLKLKDVSARQAIDALREQAGCDISFSGDAATTGRVSVDFDNKPFWPALFEICHQLKLTPTVKYNTIRLDPSAVAENIPSVTAGAFLLRLVQVEAGPIAGSREKQRGVTVFISILLDPRLHLYSTLSVPILEPVMDENGMELLPQNDRGSTSTLTSLGTAIHAPLVYPAGAGSRIARLKGYAMLFTLDGSEKWEINHIMEAGPESRSVGGIDFDFQGVQKLPDTPGYYIQMGVHGNRKDPIILQRLEAFCASARLLDEAGNQMRASMGIPGGGDGGDSFPINMFFQIPPDRKPARLVLSIPTKMREIHVPFEFTNIPIP